MKDIEAATRRRVVEWLRAVIQERGWSAERWGNLAGVSATGITRLLNDPEGASLLSTVTIARLAAIAGSQPLLISDVHRPQLYTVPVLTEDQVSKLAMGADVQLIVDKTREDGEQIAVTYRPSPRAFAVRMKLDTLSARGIQPGDLVVIEPLDVLPPVNGSIVVAVVDDGAGAYIYQPPFLLPQSHSIATPLKLADAFILGRAVHLERPLT